MTTTQARGYTRTSENYGKGFPGFFIRITRDSDGAEMYAGPFTDGEPRRHPDWVALPADERRAIVQALQEGA